MTAKGYVMSRSPRRRIPDDLPIQAIGILRSEDSATQKQGEFVSGIEALAGRRWPAKASTPKLVALFLPSLNGRTTRGYSQNDTVYNSVKYTSC